MITKTILIVVGLLASLYTLWGVVQLISILMNSNPGTVGGGSNIAAGILPVCLGLIVSLICFKNAFTKPKE